MELQRTGRPYTIDSLLSLGTEGHFPLFHSSWIKSIYNKKVTPLSPECMEKAHQIMRRLSKFKNIERQKTVIASLNGPDRELVIKAFFKMVENRVKDSDPQIH